MTWGERSACRATVSGGSSGGTLTLGATPAAGDAIVLAIAVEGAAHGGGINCVGCGATWVRLVVTTNGPSLVLFVGYNADGVGNTATLSNIGSNAFAVVGTAFFGLRTDASIVDVTATGTGAASTSQATGNLSSAAGSLLIGAVSHAASTDDVNAPTWSGGGTNTRAGVLTQATGSGPEVAALDWSTAAGTSEHVTWTSGTSGAWNAQLVQLLPVTTTASGSLTLGGSVGAKASPGASGSLTLGGSVIPPVTTHGSLTLGSPAAAAHPVYLASFSVDVGMEASDIPLLPADTPTVDYVGDDFSDLVDYPDPTLDQWGRPIAS